MRKNVKLFTAVVLAAFFSACGGAEPTPEEPPPEEPPPLPEIIISDTAIIRLVMDDYQDLRVSSFDGSGAVLYFGSPAGEDEVLVVESLSVVLTTDKSPATVQAVVDLKVKTGAVSDVVHRLVLTQQDSANYEVWLANQPILAFVDDTQTLEVFCATNPPPSGAPANGCSASVAGRIVVY